MMHVLIMEQMSSNYVCSDLKFNLCGEKFNNHLPSAHGDDQVNLKKILHHCNADSNVLLQNTNQLDIMVTSYLLSLAKVLNKILF